MVLPLFRRQASFAIAMLALLLCVMSAWPPLWGEEAGATPSGDDGRPASQAAPASRRNDQHWMINTRCLGLPPADLGDAPALSVWRYERDSGWAKSSVEEFLAAQSPGARVCVHLHGARTGHQEAVERGFLLLPRLTGGVPPEEPVTLVTWSWPTAPAGRPLRDLRAMASRSDVESCYLAWLLSRLDPRTDVELLGFSYGARAASGAMHLLGGGTLLGRRIGSEQVPPRPLIKAVFWTPAMNNDWLLPGRYHGRAVDCAERMLIVYNPSDRAMRHYDLVAPSRKFGGLGYSGLAGTSQLGEARGRIIQWNASGQLGPRHSFYSHIYSGSVMQKTREMLFGEW